MSWRDIKWERCRDPVSSDVIDRVERELDVRFPIAYRESVLTCHAGTPRPNAFDVLDEEIGVITTGVGMFLSFERDDDESVQRASEDLSTSLPSGVIPFAIEAGGDYICFDFRKNPEDPSVVYWSHEKEEDVALSGISTDFESFMSMLREE